MAQQDQDMAIESIGLTSTLGVVPTDSDGTQEDALRWLPTYSGIITRAQIRTLDRCPSADAALTLTGQFPDVDTFWARLAYVSAKSGWKAARATEQGIKQAEQANQTDQDRDESSHAILKASFTRAWTIGRAAWVAEHDAQLTGARMSGLVMRALRTAMGIEQVELADKLRVGERSVRAWESGETLANANVSAEIWAIWDEWVISLRTQIPSGEIPILPAETDPATLRAAAILLGGHRFTTPPEPFSYCAWTEGRPD